MYLLQLSVITSLIIPNIIPIPIIIIIIIENDQYIWLKVGCGWFEDMDTAYITAIATIIEIFVIIWGLSQINKTIYDASDELEEKLDAKLAAVIQRFDFGGEPINPIQAAIGELLKNAANKNNSSGIIDLRDENGQFKKND